MDADERRRLMAEGRAAFNRGEFYEAHEFWEEVWNEVDEPERLWIQGMIQIATGLHKLGRDQRATCRTLLAKAFAKLEGAPDALDGFDLLRMRTEARAVDTALARGESADPRSVKLAKAVS
jgi:predicted metal-dependent hydrolase